MSSMHTSNTHVLSSHSSSAIEGQFDMTAHSPNNDLLAPTRSELKVDVRSSSVSELKGNLSLASEDVTEASCLTSDQDATEASHLTPSQQRILGLIVERLSRTGGRACCTKREIAHIAKCSAKTVDRAIARLRAEGIIETCECFNENGSQEGNAYRLTW